MKDGLLIIGAGGHGKVVAEIAVALGYEKIAFVDDKNPEAICKTGLLKSEYTEGFVAIGNNQIREKLQKLLKNTGYKIPILIHPTAYVSASAILGEGTVVEPMAVVNANVQIEDGGIVSVGATVDHDVQVGKYSHINAGSIVYANSVISDYQKIDANCIAK